MCKFCNSLTDKTKEITWNVRSTYADDNICEFVNDRECGNCDKCIMHFNLDGHEHEGDVYVSISYTQEIGNDTDAKVIIRPFSESIQFNFCPICGKQISKEIREFEKCYTNQISIDEKQK